VQSTISIPRLRAALHGRVIMPGDTGYDHARTVFYGGFDQRRPAGIVRVADATDVARVVELAGETGLELAVRSGGDGLAGYSTSDGGILLDRSDMKALDIDAEGRTAWAQTGLTGGEYATAAAAHGLATGFGDTGSVGIGGLTLCGGIGFLVRKHGLTIDNLLAAELVTADGQVLHTDDQTHPELFWALGASGGNFGVATRLQFRLHQLDQSKSPKGHDQRERRTTGVEPVADGDSGAARPVTRRWPGPATGSAASQARRTPCWLSTHTSQGALTPATAGNAPARPTCWTTTGRCNARSRPSRRPIAGPAGPTGTPAGRCGAPASGSCWPWSRSSPADPPWPPVHAGASGARRHPRRRSPRRPLVGLVRRSPASCDDRAETTTTGRAADQAALRGLPAKVLARLGLELLEVRRTDPADNADGATRCSRDQAQGARRQRRGAGSAGSPAAAAAPATSPIDRRSPSGRLLPY
jgi:hypothetical protein